jgi:Kdo2-lipid IVA lauroyltransferase/acyltransferase
MFLLKLCSRLPLRVLYGFSDFLFFVTYHVMGYRKKIVRGNLERSFPLKNARELKQIQKQFYHNLCDYGVETLKLLTISREELNRRMVFKNPELLNDFAKKNQSVIILASHQFNWEWLLAAGCFSLPMQVDFVYQAQTNNFFNDFSLACRTRFGGRPIIRENVARELIMRRGLGSRAIAIVADQFPGQGQDKRYWTQFLNQNTAFFQGLERLAELTQFPAFFFSVKKIKRGYYEATGELISLPPYDRADHAMLERYAGRIEHQLMAFPSNWLWTHNRWKELSQD